MPSVTAMKIALLCSGLGHVRRGHEVFAQSLFELLREDLDLVLFKGGGAPAPREIVIDNIPRASPLLEHVQVRASAKWQAAVRNEERMRVEGATFAHAALKPLLEGGFDIVHCLEREVCEVVHDFRHLFAKPPKIVFSNGGAIAAEDLPHCDYVQEHTPQNLAQSARRKAFMIPHGVDTEKFRPGLPTDFRARHAIPADAFVVISVGTVCYWHKRMDHVIREVAAVPGAWLVIAGEPSPDSPEIERLGRELMGGRIVFTSLTHEELPLAYAAADAFALGSLFETFGIVYIEAMASGLPVFCTQHPNQRSIVQVGCFLDMARPGALSSALASTPREQLARWGAEGRAVAVAQYDLKRLRQRYVEQYRAMHAAPLPGADWSVWSSLRENARNAVLKGTRRLRRLSAQWQ